MFSLIPGLLKSMFFNFNSIFFLSLFYDLGYGLRSWLSHGCLKKLCFLLLLCGVFYMCPLDSVGCVVNISYILSCFLSTESISFWEEVS